MSWYSYEDAKERAADLQRDLERRRARGEKLDPLKVPAGSRKLTLTFWGKAWCDHLESLQTYESRLPRGRSYLRKGNVYNLEIAPGVITAEVAGSEMYDVRVTISPLDGARWKEIRNACEGQVASLLDLLAGKLGDGVLRTVTDRERGLFPKAKEIRFDCSCPDHADLCKHVAAVLYGVGVQLDTTPELFFVLRSVDPGELLASAPAESLNATTDGALEGEDLSALFGIDLATQ